MAQGDDEFDAWVVVTDTLEAVRPVRVDWCRLTAKLPRLRLGEPAIITALVVGRAPVDGVVVEVVHLLAVGQMQLGMLAKERVQRRGCGLLNAGYEKIDAHPLPRPEHHKKYVASRAMESGLGTAIIGLQRIQVWLS